MPIDDRRREVQQERHRREHQADGERECGRHGAGRPSRTRRSSRCSTTGAGSVTVSLGVRGVIRTVCTNVSAYGVPTAQASRTVSRCSDAGQHPGVDGVEVGDRRRGVRREGGVDVRDAGDHVALDVDAVEPLVLADEPVPVVAALGVVLADADHAPGQRDLLRPVRVRAQRAAAGLHDGGAGGRGGEVDQPGDRPRVPALAEQPARADQDLAVPLLEEPRHPRHPVAAGPGALLGPRGEVRVVRRDVLLQRLQRLGRPGDGPAGDEQRVQVGHASARGARSASRAEPASCDSTPSRSAGSVAVACSWSQSTSIRIRGPSLRCSASTIWVERDDLRLAAGEHPVDRAAAAADPAPGELVPDRRQHRPDPLDDCRRPRRWCAGARPSPRAAAPSRRRWGRAGAARSSRAPSGSAISPACTIRSAASCASLARRLLEPAVEPGEERRRAVRRVAQRRGQLGEPLALRGEPVVLGRRSGWSARPARRTAPGRPRGRRPGC